MRFSWSLPGSCEVTKLTTRRRGDFQCSTRVSESLILSHRVLENLCSGHEVNKKLTKQHDCCLNNVHDVAYSDFLEAAYLLQVLRKKVVRLEPLIFTTVDLLLVLCLLTIVSDAALVAGTFEITHSSNFESR